MKKIYRYKTIIVFSLVFLIAFGVVTDYKQKEANAVAGVDDLILWTLGSLILASGVVAVSGNQITDMGQMVVDRLNNLDQDIEYIKKGAVITGVKIGNSLIEAINYVSSILPTTDKVKTFDMPYTNEFSLPFDNFPKVTHNGIDTMWKDYYENGLKLLTLNVTSSGYFSSTGSHKWSSKYATVGGTINFVGYSSSNGRQTVTAIYRSPSGDYSTFGGIDNPTSYNVSISSTNGSFTLTGYEAIPYSNPLVKENYNPTYTNDNLTLPQEKEGYIPIPSAIPTDIPISTDMPLDWDRAKEYVQPIPVDTPVDDVLDIPNEGSVELPSEQTGLWGWLSALLRAIFNILKAILNSILGFINALLEGLLNLLKSLFVPNDTYFTDSFNSLRNSFGNRLNIDSYTRLFNSDYADSTIKDITINIYGKTVTIVKFSMYENFRNVVNTMIYAFMFFLLAIYNYSQVYKLIRGSDYVSASSTITHMGGGMTSQDVIKADSISRSMARIGGKK